MRKVPKAKTGKQSGMGGLKKLKVMLRQAEGRRGEMAGNARSFQSRPLSSQNFPGLGRAGCKVTVVGAG